VSTRQAEAKEVKVGRTLKRYWRLRVPKNLSRGAAAVVVEAGGERWQMSLDRHGRLYVPSRLRPMFEEAKTIMVRREDDTLVLKLLSYKLPCGLILMVRFSPLCLVPGFLRRYGAQ
jgi:hypothetical protein